MDKDEDVILDYDLWYSPEFQLWARQFLQQDPKWLLQEDIRRMTHDIQYD